MAMRAHARLLLVVAALVSAAGCAMPEPMPLTDGLQTTPDSGDSLNQSLPPGGSRWAGTDGGKPKNMDFPGVQVQDVDGCSRPDGRVDGLGDGTTAAEGGPPRDGLEISDGGISDVGTPVLLDGLQKKPD